MIIYNFINAYKFMRNLDVVNDEYINNCEDLANSIIAYWSSMSE